MKKKSNPEKKSSSVKKWHFEKRVKICKKNWNLQIKYEKIIKLGGKVKIMKKNSYSLKKLEFRDHFEIVLILRKIYNSEKKAENILNSPTHLFFYSFS